MNRKERKKNERKKEKRKDLKIIGSQEVAKSHKFETLKRIARMKSA